MAEYVRKHWLSDGTGMTRRERQSCEYAAYLPDALADRAFKFDADVAADVADSEAAIIRLNESAQALANTEALARILLRAESVASSRIEGLEVNARRLLRADAAKQFGAPAVSDVTAEEILGNIDAVTRGLVAVDEGASITADMLCELHTLLLEGTQLHEHAGRVREQQNWIGGNSFNPCGAAFVPPPPEHVRPLLEDLCAFCNGDDLPAVAQAAIAHAQFETIHPFADGNGRIGRALIHMVLRRRALAPRIIPPVSLLLATFDADYVQGLGRFRYEGPPDAPSAHEGTNEWVAFFAGACARSVADARDFEARVKAIRASWIERLGSVRANSTLELALDVLPGTPVVNAAGLARLTDRSFEAANNALQRLLEAGIVAEVDRRKRGRVYEARQIIEEFTGLERRMASPSGDTRTAPPSRPVPYRP